MGLLPCLRRGSDRWWLPCGADATEVIGSLLLATGRTAGVDPATRGKVLRTLLTDPPLLIFTALHCPGSHVDADQLVDWLAEHAADHFAGGDAFLAAPTITPAIRRRWNKLRDHFRTVPVENWLADASMWLEVTGPRVSNRWREQWPVWSNSEHDATDIELGDDPPANCMLQQLARTMQRQRSLEETFERELRESKLGALKQLAYGLSHEINNPLANISTRAEQLRRGEEDPTRSATLQRIIDQVYRAHEMVADLMFYANPPAAVRTRCDLNTVLGPLAETFHEEVDRQAIRLEVITPDEPTTAVVDANMIEEAVRALIRNAIEAIGCQGTIVVSLVREQGRLLIHVADSGPGLSDDARQHAFDPYFSGREAGRGLGMGLCRAYRIAKLHFGEISLAGGPTGCVATITLSDHESADPTP